MLLALDKAIKVRRKTVPYLEKRYYIKNRIEVEQLHSSMYGNHAPRLPRWKPTPEEMRKLNIKYRGKKLRRLIDLNFTEGDCYYTWTYARGERYSLEESKKHIERVIDRFRYQYKKRKIPFKWFWTWGVTSTGKPHHHIILNFHEDIPYSKVIRKYFPYGKVVNEWMYQEGNFERLAEYFVKHKDEREEAKVQKGQEPTYRSSRNLIKPKARSKIIRESKLNKKPYIPKGFILNMREDDQGVTKDGYRYRFYVLERIPERDSKQRRKKE